MQTHSKNFMYFRATKYELHNQATKLKIKCKYFDFWFDLSLACRLGVSDYFRAWSRNFENGCKEGLV